MWSIGVIAFIIFIGCPPFNGANEDEILKAIEKGTFEFEQEIWDQISTQAKDFIK